jgi:hypothetical protein
MAYETRRWLRPPLDATLLTPLLARAEDALARLDERLATSPAASGFCARLDFEDSCAAAGLAGALVGREDLALHDDSRDVRPPSPDLAYARAVLTARRRLAVLPPGAWEREEGQPLNVPDGAGPTDEETALAEAMAALDRAEARTKTVLAGLALPPVDEPAQGNPRTDWRAGVANLLGEAPCLAAALALEGARAIDPFEREPWRVLLAIADQLRAVRKTRHHLPGLAVGLRLIGPERREAADPATRVFAFLAGVEAGALWGFEFLRRLETARAVLLRQVEGRRGDPAALVAFVMARPVVSAAGLAQALGLTERAALNAIAALGLRETTGRRRYRAWGLGF